MRYRLPTLIALVSIVCAILGVWLAYRELAGARVTIARQRQEIRALSHELGRLTPEDRESVNVQRVLRDGELSAMPSDHDGIDLQWKVHLPKTVEWRLYWAHREIPKDGLPKHRAGFQDLEAIEGDWESLRLWFPYASGEWSADFMFGETMWTSSIPNDASAWLEPESVSRGECAGPVDHHTNQCFIEAFPIDAPIILYRDRALVPVRSGDSYIGYEANPEPCQGFMLWIESVD